VLYGGYSAVMDAHNSNLTRITVLGSTGSVGCNTLEVISKHDNFEIAALTAFSNVPLMLEQCRAFKPDFAVMADPDSAAKLSRELQGSETEVLAGAEALAQVASLDNVQTVMAAIVGAAGLEPTLAAVKTGKRVLLANKESLVMAGELFMQCARENQAVLLPIDSEHNAIFQCLPSSGSITSGTDLSQVKKVILTASGGPFLNLSIHKLDAVTPDQACAHPRWEMGRKISVDSATLMNKGLEYIEACFLFGLENNQLEVVIHPQSIVHSMVEFVDGSVIAQLASPDMKVPIAYGLAWPERINSGAESLDLCREEPLEFRQPDLGRFPCLGLGMQAAEIGGSAPAILNAANEEAVSAFLAGELSFGRIHQINEAVMAKIPCEAAASLDIILQADNEARIHAKELIVKANQ
jgi:1-deoxy-D-xylulose-5-phosphate reductoisomerase